VLAITGDEEGQAKDGTLALLDWMNDNNETINHCIVGEPTCPENMGEMMKIGRRGSMTAYFTVRGIQGHSAYPHRAKNPLPVMAELICDLTSFELDQGSEHFDPSTLAVTTIDTGNLANNVIPAECRATVNIRFNDMHTSEELSVWLKEVTNKIASKSDVEINMEIQVSGESFITALGSFSDLVSNSVYSETGIYPQASTSGGTSDARFVKDHCPVVEFGLVGKTMHQVDERVSVNHIHQLKAIYANIIKNYFA
jgi:succinyl-diaminopimelate desuccinylase